MTRGEFIPFMKFNTAVSVIVLFGAVQICSGVMDSETGARVTDLDAVAQELQRDPGSNKYILTKREAEALSKNSSGGLESALIQAELEK